MSGTLRAVRHRKAQQDEMRKKAVEERQRQAQLQENREAVIAQVCKAFGWKNLDAFAQQMITTAFAGKIVDIKSLKADLQKWKEARGSDSRQEE